MNGTGFGIVGKTMRMKALVSVLLMVLMSGAFMPAYSGGKIVSVPSKDKNLFVLKADQDFMGATVEVYHSNGDLVTTHTLQKRKVIIYFCDVEVGEYTIRVVKGDKHQEFKYRKE